MLTQSLVLVLPSIKVGFTCCKTYQLDLGVSCTVMRNGALFKNGDAGSPALANILLPSFQQLCNDCLLALKCLSEIIFLSVFLVILRRHAVKPATCIFSYEFHLVSG